MCWRPAVSRSNRVQTEKTLNNHCCLNDNTLGTKVRDRSTLACGRWCLEPLTEEVVVHTDHESSVSQTGRSPSKNPDADTGVPSDCVCPRCSGRLLLAGRSF